MLEEHSIEMASAVAVAIVLLSWFFYRRYVRKNSSQRQIEQVLKSHKLDEMKNVILPDGVDGLIEVDRIVLLEQGILVLRDYPINGYLFGAESIEQWTQIVGGRSYKFSNPLHHLEHTRHAIRALIPKMPVFCHVVFTAEGNFPKGKPAAVSVIETFEQDLQRLFNGPKLPESFRQQMWDSLKQNARIDAQSLIRK